MNRFKHVGAYVLDEDAVRTWLADPAQAPWCLPGDALAWTPHVPGSHEQVAELIAAAQRHRHLTGPGDLSLLFTSDTGGDAFRYLIELAPAGGGTLRLATRAHSWEMICPAHETGVEAAVTALSHATTEANAVVYQLNRLVTEPPVYALRLTHLQPRHHNTAGSF